MEYFDDLGLIADIMFFNTIYFNECEMKKHVSRYEDSEDALDFYNKIKNNIIKMPEHLEPFFYKNYTIKSFMSSYVQAYSNCTFDEFISFLTNNKDNLKDSFINHYLTDYTTSTEIINIIQYLECDESMKLKILYIISNFEDQVDIMVNVLTEQRIQMQIERSKENKINIIKKFEKQITSKDIFNILVKLYPHSKEDIKNIVLSISYLFPYAISCTRSDPVYLLLGLKWVTALKDMVKYNNISFRTYCYIRTNVVRNKILLLLSKRKELCTTEIIDILSMQDESITIDKVNSALYILKSEMALKVSRKENKNNYYTINVEYFKIIDEIYQNEKIKFIGGDT